MYYLLKMGIFILYFKYNYKVFRYQQFLDIFKILKLKEEVYVLYFSKFQML